VLVVASAGSILIIPFLDKVLYNQRLLKWLSINEECKCKFESFTNETVYCKNRTLSVLPYNTKKYTIGNNMTCYVENPIKSIDSVKYDVPEYYFMDSSPLFFWLCLSIIFLFFSFLTLYRMIKENQN